MYRMTRHLIDAHGCKKIYCITGFPDNRPSAERTEGYRQAMQEAGLPFTDQDIFYGHFWREVPQQIAVTGFDGSSDAWMHKLKLTTVTGRDLQLGADAVRKLYGIITWREISPFA